MPIRSRSSAPSSTRSRDRRHRTGVTERDSVLGLDVRPAARPPGRRRPPLRRPAHRRGRRCRRRRRRPPTPDHRHPRRPTTGSGAPGWGTCSPMPRSGPGPSTSRSVGFRRPGDRAALGRALPARLGSGQGRRCTDHRPRTRGDRARRTGPAAARRRRRPGAGRPPALRVAGGGREDATRSIAWWRPSDATRGGLPTRSPATPGSRSASSGTTTSSCPTAPAAASVRTGCGYATRCSPAPTGTS